jgi:heme-degrading monooxygenase HmoA
MVLEIAVIDVVSGSEAAFEAAVEDAKSIVAGHPGCMSFTLSRCVEITSRFVLLVEWERLDDHVEGFRGSPDFTRWRSKVQEFFASPPHVEHYEIVTQG